MAVKTETLMKAWLNKHFDLTKREFNGLMVLVTLILLISAFPYLYNRLFPFKNDLHADQLAIQELAVVDQYPAIAGDHKGKETDKAALTLYPFDPNTIDVSGWQKLGLSLKQAQSVLKYRNKGGRFYKREDLRKMYTISPEMYARLTPYVQIGNAAPQNGNSLVKERAVKAVYVSRALPVTELNGADTLQLDQVRGIGPAFARRIVKYRERLGGFYHKEQLLEVFGLDTLKFREIKDQISVDTALVKKININTAVFDDLKDHPYLRYKQVNALIQYRKQHGNYSNIEDLKKVVILTAETIIQLTPYLSF